MYTSNNLNNSNQQTLADLGANERPPMLEKGNYILWESRFRRFLDNNLEEGERTSILEPLSKMTRGNKKQYIADVRVMNYLLQAIPNDIYNSVDACKNAKEMWEQIKRLMHGSAITTHVRHSRLMDEFDKFAAKEGESLDSVYERMEPICYHAVSYDVLYDLLVQFEPHVLASRAKKAAKNHDPLALIAHSHANKNARRNRNQMFNAGNESDESNQIVQHIPRTNSIPIKANVQEQMLLAMKDESGSHLSNEENDFMLDNAYGEESLDELTASVMLMARLQPADGNTDTMPSYDKKVVSQINDPSKAHEQVSHVKRKTIIQTTNDDQVDSSIIFDDLFMDNNGAENQKRLNNELKRQKDLLQQELETFKDRLPKKDFKERDNRYLEDIVDLEEKLSSHDRIVYKIGQSLQTIHMLGKKPNKVYDPFPKAGLG
ncbi:hypothetical protein Tco_1077557, partial [Tanacetum coccineum]